jgi:hypothetical protein
LRVALALIYELYVCRREHEKLRIAILELITAALESQTGLAELFLQLEDTADGDIPKTIGKQSCLYVILHLLSEKQNLLKRAPKLVASANDMLHALWLAGSEHYSVLCALRRNEDFWKRLLAPLQYAPPRRIGTENRACVYVCECVVARTNVRWCVCVCVCEWLHARMCVGVCV